MTEKSECTHGVVFDEEAAKKLIAEAAWAPIDDADWIMGDPTALAIRKRWPRLSGKCPLGCGYEGIYYASMAHYIMGDW